MPEKIRLTQKRVADLQPVAGKQFDVWDAEQPRFAVRVSPRGRKTFFVMRRVKGKLVRATVGTFPEMNVDTARKMAAEMLVSMTAGVNPNIERKRERAQQKDKSRLLSAVFDSYLASGGKDGDIKASTKAAYRSAFRRLEKWQELKIDEIESEMVEQLHVSIVKDCGGYAANHSIGLLRALMKFAKVEGNPAADVAWAKETPRREAMPPEAIPGFLKALDQLKGDNGSDLFRVLLFTGMRKSEAMGLRWIDIDLENKSLHIEETKTGPPLNIPISGHLAAILEKRKERISSPWVFPSNSRVGHLTNDQQFCRELAALGVRVYPHLLRKTFTTIAASLIPGAMVDCLTGHVPQDVTGRHYTFPSVGQLRPHTEAVTKEILSLAGITTRSIK
ncbi:tyrosine-type recombinase/integrase [Pelobacter propionicus]|uniref:Phage integrase family protein n=1 Tax=Pelobacter propionicus (strain DSM 2379 / NBRC 103807 / OttBd1) TaxID=338966 RepID=A1AQX4_PELPD|nr:integrase family protein [Pelobacter propionicus]ABK99744.1 phage integrase family protein [Pelobacter propionicus DSM 2379]